MLLGDVRMRAGVLEDLQHTWAGDVPDLWAELLPIENNQVFQTVGTRARQLLIVCTVAEGRYSVRYVNKHATSDNLCLPKTTIVIEEQNLYNSFFRD